MELARSYLQWVELGWLTFDASTSTVQNKFDASTPAVQNKAELNKDLPIVLSVDDSCIVQAKIKEALGNRYQVLLASNAVEALNILKSKPVSILILDVMMPDVDGLKLCRTIRSIPKFQNLPVVMVTAQEGLVNKLKGQIAGTNHYLTKPFDPETLLEIVGEYV